MDYEVFLLGRIKEYVDARADDRRGGTPRAAALRPDHHVGRAAHGHRVQLLRRPAGWATSQQIGLGLTVAVPIDATIVRCVLVPATMTLLGRWNWWAPAWLTPAAPADRPGRAPAAPAAPRRSDRRRSGRLDVAEAGQVERSTSSQPTGGALVWAVQTHGPLQGPPALPDRVGVDEPGQPDAGAAPPRGRPSRGSSSRSSTMAASRWLAQRSGWPGSARREVLLVTAGVAAGRPGCPAPAPSGRGAGPGRAARPAP